MVNWNNVMEFGITLDMLSEYNNRPLYGGGIEAQLFLCREIIYQCRQRRKEIDAKQFLQDMHMKPERAVKKLLASYNTRMIKLKNNLHLLVEAKASGFPKAFDPNADIVEYWSGAIFYDTEVRDKKHRIMVDRDKGVLSITVDYDGITFPCGITVDLYTEMLTNKKFYIDTVTSMVDAYYAGEFIYNGYEHWSAM